MDKIMRSAVLSMLALAAIALPAWPQEGTEKNSSEQAAPAKGGATNSTEKTKSEGSTGENSFNFPSVQGPVELRARRGTRITLKLNDTSQAAYQSIGEQAKINVLFDPDYVSRKMSLDLNNVSLEDALKVVAFTSRTFWRPVTSDTIFVAPDTPAKRRDYEQQTIKTFYFPNLGAPTDMQDLVNALRTLVEVQRIQQMPGFHTITIRATPEQMALVEKIVDEASHAKQKTGGEYRVEYKISEAGGDKTASKTYSMLTEPREVAKLRTGWRVPYQSSDKEKSYLEVGKRIDCIVRAESERTVTLHMTVESSEVDAGARGPGDTTPINPVIQQSTIETNVTLELGTPTVVGNFQDPASKRNFQIEATVTRAKSKE